MTVGLTWSLTRWPPGPSGRGTGCLLALGGFCVVTFNVIFESLRQQLIPDRLLGCVISVQLFSYGTVALGALIGGLLARSFGLPAPFLVAGVAIPVMTLLILAFGQPSHGRAGPCGSGAGHCGSSDGHHRVATCQSMPTARYDASEELTEWRRNRRGVDGA
jgi:hypothetical protein